MMLRTQAVVPDGHGRLATSPTAVFDTGEESIAIKSLIILPQELLDLAGEAARFRYDCDVSRGRPARISTTVLSAARSTLSATLP